ncbi:Ig kappa chain V19-17-like, partial [Clarias magur]
MVQYVALPVCLCVMGLLSETLCSLTLEAEAGDKVTIWCQHDLSVTGYVSWFKHTSDSVPLSIGCKQFFTSAPSETCYFFTESERIIMSVQGKKTSLTITAVNVSDTGLYYCGYMEQNRIAYSDSVYLRVKGLNKTLSKITERTEGADYPAVFFMLTVVFAAATVILLSLLIIKLRDGKTDTGAEAEDNK